MHCRSPCFSKPHTCVPCNIQPTIESMKSWLCYLYTYFRYLSPLHLKLSWILEHAIAPRVVLPILFSGHRWVAKELIEKLRVSSWEQWKDSRYEKMKMLVHASLMFRVLPFCLRQQVSACRFHRDTQCELDTPRR